MKFWHASRRRTTNVEGNSGQPSNPVHLENGGSKTACVTVIMWTAILLA